MVALAAMTGMVRDMDFQPEAMRKALGDGYPTATDLADWMVRELNLPFREAHQATGKIVALAESKQARLDQLSLEDLQSVLPAITEGALGVLTVEQSVASRDSEGGTAPRRVRDAVKDARK